MVQDSTHVVVMGNNFDRNPRYKVNGFGDAERNGVAFRDSTDSSFIGNLVSGVRLHSAAVEVSNCERMQISNNSVLDSDGHALRLFNVSKSIVGGNLLRDDRKEHPMRASSMIVEGGSDNLIHSNSVSAP